jgi:hypothetical protein
MQIKCKKADKIALSEYGFYNNDLIQINEMDYTFEYRGEPTSFAAIRRLALDEKQTSFSWNAVLVSIARSAFLGTIQFGNKKDVVVSSWNKEWI